MIMLIGANRFNINNNRRTIEELSSSTSLQQKQQKRRKNYKTAMDVRFITTLLLSFSSLIDLHTSMAFHMISHRTYRTTSNLILSRCLKQQKVIPWMTFRNRDYYHRPTNGILRSETIMKYGSSTKPLFSSSSDSSTNTKETKNVGTEEVDPGNVPGTNLRIVKYPHPSLRRTNVNVTQEEIDDGSIIKIAREMFLIMYAANGCGLAAPQVGINKRLMVYNEYADPKKWLHEMIYINPIIVDKSTVTEVNGEGCLSFPNMMGKNGEVERNKWIKIEALNSKGKKIKKKFVGIEAIIFQHEYDHLDGIVYIDRLLPYSKELLQSDINELIQQYKDNDAII